MGKLDELGDSKPAEMLSKWELSVKGYNIIDMIKNDSEYCLPVDKQPDSRYCIEMWKKQPNGTNS